MIQQTLPEYQLYQELCEQERQVWCSEKYKEIDKNRLKLSKKIVGERAKSRTHWMCHVTN